VDPRRREGENPASLRPGDLPPRPPMLVPLLLAFAPAFTPLARGQEVPTVTVAFWNVENLFDAVDDPANPGDDEFLPGNGWTEERYRRKLARLAETIAAMDPHVLGVAEIENRRVLEDLVAQAPLRDRGWRIAHRESPDKRGIDVGLLYRAPFEVADEKADVVLHEIPIDPPTRGVLEVRLHAGPDALGVLVNHWPSRIGGVEKTRELRKKAAGVCRRIVHERVDAAKGKPDPDLLVMGDLNDNPSDEAVAGVLGATPEKGVVLGEGPDARYAFWNPMFRFVGEKRPGTITFRGRWSVFDQLAVSRGLLEKEGFELDESSVEIFATDAMKDRDGGPKRFRRIEGGEWIEGYSDHFPIRAKLRRAAPAPH
jgi:endonuclease/exonuclease/phosphatase family metal-dependent hydrolase